MGQKATNRIAAIDGLFDHLAATILGKRVQPAYPRINPASSADGSAVST